MTVKLAEEFFFSSFFFLKQAERAERAKRAERAERAERAALILKYFLGNFVI